RVWRAALPHLASLASEDLDTVWGALTKARPEQRAELIDAMARADAVRVADLALQHAQAPDPDERRLAVALAGQGGTEASVQACVQALQDPVADVRRQAAASLGRIKSPQAASALGGSLSDPDPSVREQVVRALGVIDSEAVLGFLVQALQDPSKDVRETASQVLTEWSSPAVARRLAGVLATPALRDQAIDLLTKMGASATELLVDVLLHSTPEMVPTVGSLLDQLVGADHFVERLHAMDPKQRRRAMTALAAIGGPAAVEHALVALGDPDQHVRTAAVKALGALGDPRTAEAVAHVADSDPIPEVAEAARGVLTALRPA
ncbi:MAG: HEAT repeat domain-containing protein, partial [Actinomycetota bacterium]